MNRVIIFYDSWCALCHWAVRLVYKRDQKKAFFYAPLDGVTAKEKLQSPDMESIAFLDETGAVFQYSKALFRILWHLGFPYNLIGWLGFLPGWMLIPSDWIYKLVAKARSRSCELADRTPNNTQFLP